MIPDTSVNNTVELYEAVNFPRSMDIEASVDERV